MRTGDQISRLTTWIQQTMMTSIGADEVEKRLREFHAATYREGYADGKQDECEEDEE